MLHGPLCTLAQFTPQPSEASALKVSKLVRRRCITHEGREEQTQRTRRGALPKRTSVLLEMIRPHMMEPLLVVDSSLLAPQSQMRVRIMYRYVYVYVYVYLYVYVYVYVYVHVYVYVYVYV